MSRDMVDDLLLRRQHRLYEPLAHGPFEKAEVGARVVGERESRCGRADAQHADVGDVGAEKVLGFVKGDEVGGIRVETSIRIQPVADLRDREIARSGRGGERYIDSFKAVVAPEVGMMAGLEYLGSAFSQADGRDDAGVFEITETGVGANDVNDRVSQGAWVVLRLEHAAQNIIGLAESRLRWISGREYSRP